jgi:hypothetical protein
VVSTVHVYHSGSSEIASVVKKTSINPSTEETV